MILIALIFISLGTFTAAPAADVWKPASGQLRKLAGDLKFCEGPVWTDADGGFLVFSDIPASKLLRWREKDGLTVYRDKARHTNGNARAPGGALVTCVHGDRQVLIDAPGGKQLVIAREFDGRRLNSPNDAVVHSNGTVYFTDPTYGLQNEASDKAPGVDATAVYRVDAQGKAVERLAADFDQPNGLCLSPDEKILYVADSGRPHHIKAFDVNPDGKLGKARVFAVIDKGAPDGIRCDAQGRVWSSAGDGIHVFTPDGKLAGKIPVPETPANLCFGGPDWKTLFITARTKLYAVDVNATIPANLKR